MTYKIVFFDIDGTLVNEEKEIPQDTRDALRELQASGVPAVIATGRAPYFFRSMAEELGIDSFVCLNGGYVVYKGETMYRYSITREKVASLVELAGTHSHSLVFQGEEAFFSNTDTHPHMLESVSSLRVGMPGHDPVYWQKADIFQALLHCEEHEEHLYDIPGLRFIRWHKLAMDVLPDDSSKARGINELLSVLGIRPEEAVAFGDNLNDREMLEYVGLGIAMGNSHPDLLPFADYVTSSVDEGGIRKGLRHAGLL